MGKKGFMWFSVVKKVFWLFLKDKERDKERDVLKNVVKLVDLVGGFFVVEVFVVSICFLKI